MDKPQNTEDETTEPQAADWRAMWDMGVTCGELGGPGVAVGCPTGYTCVRGECRMLCDKETRIEGELDGALGPICPFSLGYICVRGACVPR